MALSIAEAFYFTVEPIWKEVSQKEFHEYVKLYPRPLKCDAYAVFDDPVVSFNDFALADRWPVSVVAWYSGPVSLVALDAGDDDCKYHVMENFDRVFASKTGKMASTHGETPNPFIFHVDCANANDFTASGTIYLGEVKMQHITTHVDISAVKAGEGSPIIISTGKNAEGEDNYG